MCGAVYAYVPQSFQDGTATFASVGVKAQS